MAKMLSRPHTLVLKPSSQSDLLLQQLSCVCMQKNMRIHPHLPCRTICHGAVTSVDSHIENTHKQQQLDTLSHQVLGCIIRHRAATAIHSNNSVVLTASRCAPISGLWNALVTGCNDADPNLVAHSEQGSHGRFGIGAVLLLQDVQNILHENVSRPEVLHHIIEGCDLAIPAIAPQNLGLTYTEL